MKVIEKVSRSFWLDVAKNCPYATFFHTPSWAELMSKTFAYRDITKGFIFDNGTRVIFPFMFRKRRLLYDYISGPPFTYGGPIADSEITGEQLDEIVEYLKAVPKFYRSILIRGNPYRKPFVVNGFERIEDHAQIVDLSVYKDGEDFIKSKRYTYNRHIAKAKKAGLVIKKVDRLIEAELLYAMYKQTQVYWGTSKTDYQLSLYRNIYKMDDFGKNFWAVYYGNTMIGGEVDFIFNSSCCNFLASFDRKYFAFQARRYLAHNIFINCIENNIKFFDCMQSGGKESLEEFKASLGAQEVNYFAFLKENKMLLKINKIKKRLLFKNKGCISAG